MSLGDAAELPRDKEQEFGQAIRWEWATIVYLLIASVVMYVVMGNSQAMRTAFIEDLLSLVPPISFLVSHKVIMKRINRRFAYGYFRSVNLGFMLAAGALLAVGGWLLIDNTMKLIEAEHPTIGTMTLFGQTVWQGWVMIAALVFSSAGPIIFGIKKMKLSRSLHDKVLFTDAQMNKADWLSGGAAIAGIILIGFGHWWGDSVAAIIISFDVLHDGWSNLKTVFADLMDRVPMTVDHKIEDPTPKRVEEALRGLDWVRELKMRTREQGNFIFGEVFVVPTDFRDLARRFAEAHKLARSVDWRIHELVFVPVTDTSEYPSNSEPPKQAQPRSGGR